MTDHREELTTRVSRLVRDRFDGDWQAAFDHYATDHRIDKVALSKLLSDAGVGTWFTRDKWVRGVLSIVDANADGRISWSEFLLVFKE